MGEKPTEEALKAFRDAVEIVEEFLTRNKWIAGPKLTIADISYSCFFSSLPVSVFAFNYNNFAFINEVKRLSKYFLQLGKSLFYVFIHGDILIISGNEFRSYSIHEN